MGGIGRYFKFLLEQTVGGLDAKISILHERFQKFSDTGSQPVERFQTELTKLSMQVPQWLREQSVVLDQQIKQIVRECKAEFESKFSWPCPQAQQLQQDLAKVRLENDALRLRVGKLESLFGGQVVPWEKVLDMYHKVSETVSIEVKREFELRERKVIDFLVKQQLDERFRDFQSEEHFDRLRNDIMDNTQQQLRTIAEGVAQHFQAHKDERRKLRSNVNKIQTELRILQEKGGQLQSLSPTLMSALGK